MTSNTGAVIAASKLRNERQIVQTLRQDDARSPAKARPVDVHRPLGQAALRSLVRTGALIEAAPGTYYLDEDAYKVARKGRRLLMAVLIASAVTVGLLAYVYATEIQP